MTLYIQLDILPNECACRYVTYRGGNAKRGRLSLEQTIKGVNDKIVISTLRTTAYGEGSDGDDDSTYDDESERSECRDDDENNVVVSDSLTGSGDGKEPGSSASAKVADMLFYDVMKDVGVECFATLEDAIPCIEEYEKRSGIHLRVERSLKNQFKQYQCREI